MAKTPATSHEIQVQLTFSGTATICVPSSVPPEHRQHLAECYALALVQATLDNPDAPEHEACDEYARKCRLNELVAQRQWDKTHDEGIAGTWRVTN